MVIEEDPRAGPASGRCDESDPLLGQIRKPSEVQGVPWGRQKSQFPVEKIDHHRFEVWEIGR